MIAEGSGTKAKLMKFKVSLSGVSSIEQTVELATQDSSATSPDDYSATSGTVTIPAGSKTGTFSVPILPDKTIEGDETFAVNIVNSSALVNRGTATGTIQNDDVSSG